MQNSFTPIVNHSLKYNPSLDGLRGIAISLVLLFHIWPEYFSFGYVGVDIFFVLSGYLITQIIYTKLQSNSFSFKEFYRNRVRRIFPAMIIVVLTTFLIGYLFLFPSELEQLGKHIKSSAFFYQNFRLMGEVGYWDEAAQLKPLLHFWSLSIEEQFYIFWPLIIFILYKLRVNLFISLLIIFLLFITISMVINIGPFYHSLSRFWELTFGGLVYTIVTKFQAFRYIHKQEITIFIVFILSLGFSWGDGEFNIYKTLLVLVATGLLIVSISINPKHKIFSSKLLVVLGLLSFPLYLYHYVIISYMYIFGIDVQRYGGFIILVSIFVSYLTYIYVEIYARRQKSYRFSIMLFTTVLVMGLLGQYTYKEKGFPLRNYLLPNDKYIKQFIRTPAQNNTGVALVTELLGHNPINNYIKATANDLSKRYIVIMGDSHAHTSYEGLSQEFSKQGYETLLLANSSCPPYVKGAMGKNIKDLYECKERISDIYTVINAIPKVKKIIFITRGPVYMSDIGYGVVDSGGKLLNYHFQEFFTDKTLYNQKNIFVKKLKNTFKYFNKQKYNFFYLLENPELGFAPKNCMVRPFNILPTTCRIHYRDYIIRAGEYRNIVNKLTNKYLNIHTLDPKNLYCDSLYCYAIKDTKMLYADDNHHSIDGSIMQAKYLIKDIIE